MSLITKPMLADSIDDLSKLQYPLIASPKIDGIRCLTIDGRVVSRKFKDIPNHYVREMVGELSTDNLDGELLVGETFQACTSGIMSHDGEPDFTYWLFDCVFEGLDRPYDNRLDDLETWYEALPDELKAFVKVVPTKWIENENQLLAYEKKCLKEGHEGVMTRTPDGPYKCGRATEKQGWLLKLKRFKDSEARIIGFEEQMLNTNKAEKDELGHTKRSSAKAGKKGKNTLGKFIVEEVGGVKWKNPEFRIGTGEGLTDKLRKEIWRNREEYLGKIVKYKYQDIGSMDAPRLPIFLGFRDERDM